MESGMEFAKSYMAKSGWTEGRGLGREETGRTEAIKVKLKFDNAGLGHNQGEEFTFQWWDHVFNKAADNISVSKNEKGGIELHRKEELVVTKSRPSVAAMKKKLYGSFVKGGTLQGSELISRKDSSDESDDDEPRDMSMRLSDDQLFKLCGGRTAHKGARHGLNMNAKLERVRLQEEELLRKWKGEAQQDTSSQFDSSINNSIEFSGQGTPTEKKKKKKKKKEADEESLSNTGYEETSNKRKYTSDEENNGEKKKKKKKKKQLDHDTMNDSGIESVEHEIIEKEYSKKDKKKKKKRNGEIEDCESVSVKDNEIVHESEEQEQRKKKKRKKDNDESYKISEICCDNTLKKKKEKENIDFSEVEVKKKKKKKKSNEMDSNEMNLNVQENFEGNGLCIEEFSIIPTEYEEKKKKRKEKLYCSDTEDMVKKKKKKSKKSKERECEGNETNLEKLSTISKEIKEKKNKTKETASDTEIKVKKKKKSKSKYADLETT